MKSIEILLMILLLTLGTLSTKSDLKEGRIYNKTLAVFAGISIILGSVYYGYYARDLLGLFLMNYIVLAIISLILFYSHSFAGGDCKLVLGMGIIYPANYYLVYGNTFITLFFVLGFAIIYGYLFLVISSLRGLVQGKNKLTRDYVKIIYVFLTIFLYLLKCPQSLILSALRAFCFCGKPHISRSIFLYFRYQAWLKSW